MSPSWHLPRCSPLLFQSPPWNLPSCGPPSSKRARLHLGRFGPSHPRALISICTGLAHHTPEPSPAPSQVCLIPSQCPCCHLPMCGPSHPRALSCMSPGVAHSNPRAVTRTYSGVAHVIPEPSPAPIHVLHITSQSPCWHLPRCEQPHIRSLTHTYPGVAHYIPYPSPALTQCGPHPSQIPRWHIPRCSSAQSQSHSWHQHRCGQSYSRAITCTYPGVAYPIPERSLVPVHVWPI